MQDKFRKCYRINEMLRAVQKKKRLLNAPTDLISMCLLSSFPL